MNIYTIKAIKVEATTSSLSFRMALLSANKKGQRGSWDQTYKCCIHAISELL